uniref:Uncharacterized protein n=1 Tax=Marseillevirus sp. TaxID=2809551 RepID=A0AA96IZ26_9VIRU|nr:hypothetical protein MarDSR_150 [Marseillevirus sp.]
MFCRECPFGDDGREHEKFLFSEDEYSLPSVSQHVQKQKYFGRVT